MIISDDVRALNPEIDKMITPRRRGRARANIRFDDYDSALERDFDHELTARLVPHLVHPFSLHLPGDVIYTPDFIAWPVDSKPVVYEVKGSNKQKNARDSRTRFRIAAGVHRWAIFVWVTREHGRWIERVYAPNAD